MATPGVSQMADVPKLGPGGDSVQRHRDRPAVWSPQFGRLASRDEPTKDW